MKFLITENKLEQIVFKYLDNQNFIKIETNDKIEFVYSKEDRIATILYTIDTEMLRIHNELIEEISSFFSIKENFTKSIAKLEAAAAANVLFAGVTDILQVASVFEKRDRHQT